MVSFACDYRKIRFVVVAVALLLVGIGCAPPDPLEPECGPLSGDSAASDDLSQPDVIGPGDVEDPDGDSPDLDTDLGELSDTGIPDGKDLPDGELQTGCEGAADCPVEGVCAGMNAYCVDGDWHCDYEGVEGLEFGGEVSCDGVDNDCDGEIDEGLPVPELCKTAGVCVDAVIQCVDGDWDCGTDGLLGYEEGEETLADGLDNDCDGAVDENWDETCWPGDRQCADGTSFQLCEATGNAFGAAQTCGNGTACMGAGVCTVDGEFRVNDYLQSGQTKIAGAVVGETAVLVWQSLGQDEDDYGIYFRAYDETGAEVLPETRANLFTTGAQQNPAIAPLGDDAFFIAWESNGQDGTLSSLYGRTFSLEGGATAELGVAETATGVQEAVAVAVLGDSIASAWSSPDDGHILAGLVEPSGWPAAWEKSVAVAGSGAFLAPALVANEAGDVVVVWEHKVGIQRDVVGKRISSFAGDWLSGESVDIAVDAMVGEGSPQVAWSGGSVFVAWVEQGEQTLACLRKLGPALDAPSQKVCLDTDGDVLDLAIAPSTDGIVALWQEASGAPHALRMAAVDSELEITELPDVTSGTMDPDGGIDIAGFGDGRFVVVWPRQAAGNGLDVWARFVQVD